MIPNGVDADRFRRAVPLSRWQDGARNVLFVGRFEERKGLIHLLRAIRVLRREGRDDVRLLVVGGGPQEREIRRYVMTRHLQGIEFLGRVTDDEKAQLFRTADVFVSPATGRESFGIVLLEAMAAGTPIVCSDIHGYKGVVKRGEQGLLVPPGDKVALAEAIARMDRPPAVFVSTSAVGAYGSRGGEAVTEQTGRGEGFLADVCRAWEAAAEPVRDAGVRATSRRSPPST